MSYDRSALSLSIPFVAGDEIVQPFLILTEKVIPDLTGCEISAVVWKWGKEDASIAVAVELLDLDPPAAPAGSAQAPHLRARIDEGESVKLAGAKAFLRFKVIDSTGRTMQTAGAGFHEVTGPVGNVSGSAVIRTVLVGVRAGDINASPSAPTYTDDDYAAFAAAA